MEQRRNVSTVGNFSNGLNNIVPRCKAAKRNKYGDPIPYGEHFFSCVP